MCHLIIFRPVIINDDGNEKGVLLLNAQAFSEAIIVLDEILSNADEKNPANLQNMGTALEIVGNYNDAKEYFEEALKMEPDNAEAKERYERIEKTIKKSRDVNESIEKRNTYEQKEFQDN
jgi:tetratricopeptide (TPR) repeat protein